MASETNRPGREHFQIELYRDGKPVPSTEWTDEHWRALANVVDLLWARARQERKQQRGEGGDRGK